MLNRTLADSTLAQAGSFTDRRILKEEYRGHDLIARFWEFGYLGKIWKNRSPVAEIDAEDDQTLDDLVVEMRKHVDNLISEKSRSRKNKVPAQPEVIKALGTVAARFTPLEKRVLKAHAEAGQISLSDLQAAFSLNSPDSILEIYGRIAEKINEEIGYLPRKGKGQRLNLKPLAELEGTGKNQTLAMPEYMLLFILSQPW